MSQQQAKCISWTDLMRQFNVLPLWDRNSTPNSLSRPVSAYWHQANQSQRWPLWCEAQGTPLERRKSTFLQSPHSATICLQRLRSSGPGAIVPKSRATLIAHNMSCATGNEGTAQLLSLTELKSHSTLALYHWLDHWPMKGYQFSIHWYDSTRGSRVGTPDLPLL